MNDYDPTEELLIRLQRMVEVDGTFIDTTGRRRGDWVEILEDVPGQDEIFVYWAALDDHQPFGYRMVEHPDTHPDTMDLDLQYIIDTTDI